MPAAGTVEIIEDTPNHQIVRRTSDAGFTETIEWKPGREPVEQVNQRNSEQQLGLALDAMRAHVARGAFTAAQRDAALLLVLRVCIGLVKLALRRFDTAD